MRGMNVGRAIGAMVLVLAIACSGDSTGPAAIGDEDVALAAVGVDPSLTAAPGQASLPGLMLDMHVFFPRFGMPAFGDGRQCTFSEAEDRFVCVPVIRNGLTFTRSFAFYDADGNSQPQRDENTRSMNTQVGVTGTIVLDRGSVEVDRESDLTVSGLGAESTEHTLNGTEQGTTVATRSTDRGTLTVTQESGDTVTNVVVRAPRDRDDWPLSGTVVHSAHSTVQAEGRDKRSYTRRELVTFNGRRLVPLVITRNDESRNCILDLMTRRVRCE